MCCLLVGPSSDQDCGDNHRAEGYPAKMPRSPRVFTPERATVCHLNLLRIGQPFRCGIQSCSGTGVTWIMPASKLGLQGENAGMFSAKGGGRSAAKNAGYRKSVEARLLMQSLQSRCRIVTRQFQSKVLSILCCLDKFDRSGTFLGIAETTPALSTLGIDFPLAKER